MLDNIISNVCIDGWLYQKLNKEFTNPFVWSMIRFDSFVKLIKNFNILNLSNIKLVKEDTQNDENEIHLNCYTIVIDNQIRIYFAHHIYDENYNTPTWINNKLYYNKMDEYLLEKYRLRLSRMQQCLPIFILRDYSYNNKQIQEYISLNLNNNLYLVTNDFSKFSKYRNKIKILYTDQNLHNTIEIADQFLYRFRNNIW